MWRARGVPIQVAIVIASANACAPFNGPTRIPSDRTLLDSLLLPAPEAGTAEAQIAPVFAEHASACGLPIPPDRSPVPRRIRVALGADALARRGEAMNISGGSAMWYVYREAEVDSLAPAEPSTARLIDPMYGVSGDLLEADLRFDGAAMNRHCYGALEAAVDANTPEVPPAFASVAASADLERKSTLTIIRGTFISPLAAVLHRNDWRSRNVRLQLWTMYDRDSTLARRALYMHEFEGVMLQRVANLSDNADFGVEAGANLGAINARLRSRIERGEILDVRDVGTVIYSDLDQLQRRRARFRPLPTPREIAASLDEPGVIRPLNLEHRMGEGKAHTFLFRVDGMPGSLCSAGWTVIPETDDFYAQGTAPVVRTQMKDATETQDSVPTCIFSLSWRPPEEVLGRNDGQVRVRAIIQGRDSVYGFVLGIPIDETFYADARPVITQAAHEYSPVSSRSTGPGLFVQTWHVQLRVDQDPNDPVRNESGTVIEALSDKIICAGGREVPVSARIIADTAGIFYLDLATPPDLRDDDHEVGTYDSCEYNTKVLLPMARRGGQRLERPLLVRLQSRRPSTRTQMPKAVPPSTANQTPRR